MVMGRKMEHIGIDTNVRLRGDNNLIERRIKVGGKRISLYGKTMGEINDKADKVYLRMWINDCCNTNSERGTDRTVLYRNYTEWCEKQGVTATTRNAFYENLRDLNYRESRSQNARFFRKLSIKPNWMEVEEMDARTMRPVNRERLDTVLGMFKTDAMLARVVGMGSGYFSSVKKSGLCQKRVIDQITDITGINIEEPEQSSKETSPSTEDTLQLLMLELLKDISDNQKKLLEIWEGNK